MTAEQYQELIKDLSEHRKGIAKGKRKDYTKSSDDVLANFKNQSKSLGITELQSLGVHMEKQMSAVLNYIKTNGQSESEPIMNRIADTINYLELMWGLINDLNFVIDVKDNIDIEGIKKEWIKQGEFIDINDIPFPDENVEYKSMTRPLPPIEVHENYYGGVCEDKQQLYIEKITIDGSLEKYQTCGVFDKEKFAKEIDDFMEQYYKIRPFNTGKEKYNDSENVQDKLDWYEKETGKSFGI